MRRWLITGCSTGIGRAIAEHALGRGDQVVVTARRESDIADFAARWPETALARPLDVTQQSQVDAAIGAAIERFGGIDVLVNNAGYGYVASIEEGDEARVRAMWETNFWGVVRMVKAVLPGMRERRDGRIVNISSLAGRIANPATGYYSTTKHALEAMSAALAREVADLGVKVTAIAAGQYRTDFSGRSLEAERGAIADYDAGAHARVELVRSAHGQQPGDPAKLAAAVGEIVDMADPPIQLLMGRDAFAAVRARMEETLHSMDQHRALTESTDFDR